MKRIATLFVNAAEISIYFEHTSYIRKYIYLDVYRNVY